MQFGSLREWLPRGGSLPQQEWERRHRVLTGLLWANAIGLPIYGVLIGHGPLDSALHLAALVIFAVLAGVPRLGTAWRSTVVSLGLLTSAAMLVHLTDGLIEAHFYFFVMVVVLTLYESWLPFLVAVGYVAFHHGVIGTISPEAVYNHPGAWAHPWAWAGVHALFVLLAGAAGIVAWRLNERVRAQMLATQTELETIAETDALTGLGNRRKAMADIEGLLAGGRRAILVLFDLDGFKAYNDAFGHLAGDAMLARLGHRLAGALNGRAEPYRLGGDEFLLIVRDPADEPSEAEQIGVEALADQGEAFSVGTSCGSVTVPDEATTLSDALRLADQRMYARKYSARTSAMSQSRDVLVQALAERYPETTKHVGAVAELTGPLAIRLGMEDHEVAALRSAAELHDVGKVAIPEAILNKPGPLDEEEWEFMRRHTIIGERIVAAAPALAGVGGMIRSSHERWDGTGYPDQLRGEQIPLGARIISVCDAFDAMLSDRPYRPAISVTEALAELERCAGNQFDPRVVAEFVRLREDNEAHRGAPVLTAARPG